jgi:transcriptional regulator GlxA family with amidase domain
MRVALLAYDDCLTSVVSGLIDTFALASVASQRLRPTSPTVFATSVVTASGRPVVGTGGFVIAPSVSLRQLMHYDVAVVPPMGAVISEVVARETRLIGWLRRAHGRGPLLCSVCTGSFMLAEAGLLDGKRATTNAWYGDELRRDYPQIDVQTESRIVDERTVISAGTTTAFLDLAIYLIDKFGGHDVAVWTAKALSKDKNVESQRPYFLFVGRRDHGDDAVLALQDWLGQRFNRALAVEDLATHAGLSVRSLARRFHAATGLAPMAYVRRLRIEVAKRRLETSHAKVEEIREAVGYEDTRSFVRAFRAVAGTSPAEYRRRFRRAR